MKTNFVIIIIIVLKLQREKHVFKLAKYFKKTAAERDDTEVFEQTHNHTNKAGQI